jgi:hypothetical protein
VIEKSPIGTGDAFFAMVLGLGLETAVRWVVAADTAAAMHQTIGMVETVERLVKAMEAQSAMSFT